MKMIVSVLCSATLCIGSLGAFSLHNNNMIDCSAVDETEQPEERIFRTSIEGTAKDNSAWEFVFSLSAFDSGHIHIDVQCKRSDPFNCNQIGAIEFDDSMIAAVGEKGYAGISAFGNDGFSRAKYFESFSDNNVIYTTIYSDADSRLGGTTLMSFDLYVKETYLHTNQKMVIFGEKIEIPFGDPLVDKDAIIEGLQEELAQYKSGDSVAANLEQQLIAVKAENEALRSAISILSKTKFCDVDQDGVVGVSDAQLVLEYYTAGMIGLVAEDEPIEIWYTKRNTVTE